MTHTGPRPAPGEAAVTVDAHDLDGLLGFFPHERFDDGGACARMETALDEALAVKRSGVLPRNRALPADVVDIVTDTAVVIRSTGLPEGFEPPSMSLEPVGGTDGPDQGDPAAPVLWEVLDRDGRRWDTCITPDLAQRQADDIGGTVVALVRAPGAVAAAPPGDDRAEVVTLCGSTRFKDAFHAENQRLTMEGHLVISLGVFGHTDLPDYDWTTDASDLKRRLDRLHFQKIDMADRIHVVAPGGYVGESTRREIAYAEQHGKTVTWSDPDAHQPAAAPPGDEDRLEAATRAYFEGRMLPDVKWDDAPEHVRPSWRAAAKRVLDAADAVTPPAPPTGHEDEATVDPVLGYYARVRALEPSAEMLAVIEAGEADRRAALAAARGPRTPGGDRG